MTGPVDPTAPLTPEAPGPSTPPPERSRRFVVWIVIATLVLGGLVGAGVVMLLSGGDDDSEVGVATSTSAVPTTSTLPAPSAPAPTTAPTAPPAPPATEVPPATAAPTLPRAEILAPEITSFEVTPTDVSCLPGEAIHPTVTWTTTRATTVSFEIEGLAWGIPMPTNATRSTTIQCIPGETPQNIVYVLTAIGPGGTTSQSVTVHVTIT